MTEHEVGGGTFLQWTALNSILWYYASCGATNGFHVTWSPRLIWMKLRLQVWAMTELI